MNRQTHADEQNSVLSSRRLNKVCRLGQTVICSTENLVLWSISLVSGCVDKSRCLGMKSLLYRHVSMEVVKGNPLPGGINWPPCSWGI
jgi:hypothetical protein